METTIITNPNKPFTRAVITQDGFDFRPDDDGASPVFANWENGQWEQVQGLFTGYDFTTVYEHTSDTHYYSEKRKKEHLEYFQQMREFETILNYLSEHNNSNAAFSKFERIVQRFYGGKVNREFTYNCNALISVETPITCAVIGKDFENIEPDSDEYRAWCNGEVYRITIEQAIVEKHEISSINPLTGEKSFRETEELVWEEDEDEGGYTHYGYDTVEEGARQILESVGTPDVIDIEPHGDLKVSDFIEATKNIDPEKVKVFDLLSEGGKPLEPLKHTRFTINQKSTTEEVKDDE